MLGSKPSSLRDEVRADGVRGSPETVRIFKTKGQVFQGSRLQFIGKDVSCPKKPRDGCTVVVSISFQEAHSQELANSACQL